MIPSMINPMVSVTVSVAPCSLETAAAAARMVCMVRDWASGDGAGAGASAGGELHGLFTKGSPHKPGLPANALASNLAALAGILPSNAL